MEGRKAEMRSKTPIRSTDKTVARRSNSVKDWWRVPPFVVVAILAQTIFSQGLHSFCVVGCGWCVCVVGAWLVCVVSVCGVKCKLKIAKTKPTKQKRKKTIHLKKEKFKKKRDKNQNNPKKKTNKGKKRPPRAAPRDSFTCFLPRNGTRNRATIEAKQKIRC